jgi:hypothetical protein
VSMAELEQACARTRGVIANTPVDMYDRPPPCPLWNVRRLINHTIAASHWVAHCATTGEAPDHERVLRSGLRGR